MAKETEEKRAELEKELENLELEASSTQKSSAAQSNKTSKALETSKKNHEKAKKQIVDLKVPSLLLPRCRSPVGYTANSRCLSLAAAIQLVLRAWLTKAPHTACRPPPPSAGLAYLRVQAKEKDTKTEIKELNAKLQEMTGSSDDKVLELQSEVDEQKVTAVEQAAKIEELGGQISDAATTADETKSEMSKLKKAVEDKTKELAVCL